MPPRKATTKDICVYLVEVDENGLVNEETIRLVRQCIQDKIFAENSDHIAICRSDMISNVEFVAANWNALRKVEAKFRECHKPSEKVNPISVLLEMCDIVNFQSSEDSYERSKILFFGHLNTHNIEEQEVVKLADTLKSNIITASFILPDQETMSEKQAQNSKIFSAVLERAEYDEVAYVTSFKKAKKQIMNTYSKKSTRSMPWNVVMEVGPDIKISVSGFVCTRKYKPTEVKKVLMKDIKPFIQAEAPQQLEEEAAAENTNGSLKKETKTVVVEVAKSVTDKEVIWKEKNGNVVDEEDVGRGYYYADKLVPFNELESENAYLSGEKCLKVLVFCPKSNIKPEYHLGDGTTLFYSKREIDSELKFDALLKAMDNNDRVAIVRKVYLKNKRVNLGVLAPDMERKCLVFSEICFADDVSVPHFAPLFKEIASEDDEGLTSKDELIDDLIKAMTIDEFDPADGPVNPSASLLRESGAIKVLGLTGGEKKPKISEDNIDVYFEKFVLTEDLTTKLKDSFALKINTEEGDRPSGANIFRKRKTEDSLTGDDDKKVKLEKEDESENLDKESGIGTAEDLDYDDLLDEL